MTFQIQFYGISNTQLSMDHFIRMIHANRFVTYTFPHEKMYIALKKKRCGREKIETEIIK